MVSIITKYIAKNFIKIFIFITLVVLTITTIYELFKRLGFYLEYNASTLLIILHLLCSIPRWVSQLLPIVTLLSILFSVGELSKHNEITAMKALGTNIDKIIFLLIILGCIIGLCDFTIREVIIPKTSKYTEFIKINKIMKKNIVLETKFYNLILAMSRYERIMIEYCNIGEKIIKNLVIEKYNNKFEITDIIMAQYALWNHTRWILYNGILRSFHYNTNIVLEETYFKKYISNIMINPNDIRTVLREVNYDNMTTNELVTYINLLKSLGQSEMKIRATLIALHSRYAYMFTHIVMMLIGASFVLKVQIQNKKINYIIALLISFIYFCMQSLTNSLGVIFLLPTFLATWSANIIFIILGLYLIMKLRK
ncbi:MAG: LptF/LptG family permease [Endomicrobium sp.]|jgi:lipopolysaccharide export system permease protein|nr:LptF/LptG family permease [Endomicrobium sp.]